MIENQEALAAEQTQPPRTASSAHTPGPWEVASAFIGPLHIRNQDGATLAHVGHEDFDTCAANARLIAAAPDLLAALQMMLDQHGGLEVSPTAKAARAAIAKATGAA